MPTANARWATAAGVPAPLASFVEVSWSTYHDYEGQTYTSSIGNFAESERVRALAGIMEDAHDTADRDGDFGGAEYVGGCWPTADPIYNVYVLCDGAVDEEESAGDIAEAWEIFARFESKVAAEAKAGGLGADCTVHLYDTWAGAMIAERHISAFTEHETTEV